MRSLSFNVWSHESILKYIHLEVFESDLYGKCADKSLRSDVFGKTSQGGLCQVCNKSWTGCPGHWGHIRLATPVYHVAWMSSLLHWCRISCRYCGHIEENKKPFSVCPSCHLKKLHVVKSDTYALSENKKPLDASEVLEWMQRSR